MSKSGTIKTRRGKPRGEKVALAKAVAKEREAARAALNLEKHRSMLLRIVSFLVREKGGDVRIPFAEISKERPIGIAVENAGQKDASVLLAVGDRLPFAPGDDVLVRLWRAWDPVTKSQPREDPGEVNWPGRVVQVFETHVRVVLVEGVTAPGDTVDVWHDWAELLPDGVESFIKSLQEEGRGQGHPTDGDSVSTRVDAEDAEGE